MVVLNATTLMDLISPTMSHLHTDAAPCGGRAVYAVWRYRGVRSSARHCLAAREAPTGVGATTTDSHTPRLGGGKRDSIPRAQLVCMLDVLQLSKRRKLDEVRSFWSQSQRPSTEVPAYLISNITCIASDCIHACDTLTSHLTCTITCIVRLCVHEDKRW